MLKNLKLLEDEMKTYAIILASGRGKRFKSQLPKQFTKLAGKLVIEHTISIFEKHPLIDEIIIVTLPEYISRVEELIIKNEWKKVSKILIGGNTRQESSFIGINSIKEPEALVLIHDAVRPLVSDRIISEVIKSLAKYDAVDVAIPSTDTIIEVGDNKIIKKIPKRDYYWRGQTPQGFKLSIIKKAHMLAKQDNFTEITDDCGLIIHYKLAKVFVVKGEESNIKITTPLDIYIADKLFQLRTIKLVEDTKLENLKGKVGIVFGASRGIGKSIVELAKKLNIKIFGFSRKNGIDISKERQVEKVLKEIYTKEGKIDFIIVTAGILRKKPLINFSLKEIMEQINTNYVGSINVAKLSFPYLKESKGHLILFSSSSYTRGRAFYSIYSSTKAAIVNLAQALSEEWAQYGIKINVICPERTATPMRFENFGREPLETLLSPEKVAKVTLSVLNTEITGQVIEVTKND